MSAEVLPHPLALCLGTVQAPHRGATSGERPLCPPMVLQGTERVSGQPALSPGPGGGICAGTVSRSKAEP